MWRIKLFLNFNEFIIDNHNSSHRGDSSLKNVKMSHFLAYSLKQYGFKENYKNRFSKCVMSLYNVHHNFIQIQGTDDIYEFRRRVEISPLHPKLKKYLLSQEENFCRYYSKCEKYILYHTYISIIQDNWFRSNFTQYVRN